jgi:hypothetical protein
VHHQGLGLSQVRIRLLMEDGRTEVPGMLWNDEAPIRGGYGSGAAFFMSSMPLEPKRAYVVEATAKRGERDVRWTWTFRTD